MGNRIFWKVASKLMTQKKSYPFVGNNVNKILVMRYGFLGDVLQTTPVLKALHKKWPKAKIDYWVSDAAAPALKNNPHINTIIPADKYGSISYKKPWGTLKNASLVRKEHYDLAVCLGSDPMYGLLAWLSGVKFRIGLITDKKSQYFLQNGLKSLWMTGQIVNSAIWS